MPAQSGAGNETEFDAAAAWEEFETALRDRYAYLDHRGSEAAERQLATSRTAAQNAKTRYALRRILQQTALTFVDPHLLVGPFDDDNFNIAMISTDLAIERRSDGFFVADVRPKSPADDAGIRPGWQVVAIDGLPVREAASVPFGPVLDAPAPDQSAWGATLAVNGRRNQPLRVLHFRDLLGEDRIIRIANPKRPDPSAADGPPFTRRWIGPDEKTALIRFNNSLGRMETIATFDDLSADLQDAAAIILDFRNTPSGGNTDIARAIIGHFIADPQAYQRHSIPAVERATTVPRMFVEYALPRAPLIDAPLIVLHGRWTGSMGEGLVVGLDAAADAHTIGSNMGDLLGALWTVDLPLSGSQVYLGGEALFHVDGTPREEFIADHALPTADRSTDGHDPALHAALEYIGSLPTAP
ncbi:MAG: hypothetical protein WA908_11780 [Pontixanthobacter sp.]